MQNTVNPYGQMATEIYDFDKPVGSLPDVAFYIERLKAVTGPILEPACGTGRLLIPLIEAGHEVWGFEPSPDMLAACRRNCAARDLDPPLADMRFQDFAYDRAFAAIVVPVSTFSFVAAFAEAMAVLRRFHDHLAPGGLLMIDLQPPRRMWALHGAVRTWAMPDGDLLRLESRHVATSELEQRVENHMRYERWRGGRLVEAELEIMVGRYWGRHEFELALAAAGFTDVRVLGDYRRRPARDGDAGLTFEAVRAA